jgi:transcriptional antiterminator NusG
MAKRWYIVHAYSNFENKVAQSIKDQAQQRGLADKFDEVMVPTEAGRWTPSASSSRATCS